ncbi:extracellular catalytic domain type 1 short-chain-length polyhydroxyalkanoate depolymerase [Mycolicibacterium mengxianglii]|uniref:extracellular catalytic domain type 1 short-chain-length polyhydroxyalkanoate depolymerase n=1 Tax=Mycolicibacterium mengxianglii TaxID=2736649 RepID=UPI001E338AC3
MAATLCVLAGFTAATPASAEPFAAAHFDFGGLPRTYTVHVPPGKPTGLVINLHSAGGTGAGQAALTHYDAIADAHGFVVAYPDGIDYSWADGRGASTPDRQGIDDVGFISALVTKLVADFGIDPNRVYATGLSAGAFMANRLACQRADLFAAIAPVDGTLGTNVGCAPSEPVAVMATHGTADPVVPFNGGPMLGRGGGSTVVPAQAMADRWRNINGCRPPAEVALPDNGDGMRSLRSSSACADGADVVFTRVEGGGHTWPGAPTVLSEQQVGRTTRAFDASVDSANFFAGHVR